MDKPSMSYNTITIQNSVLNDTGFASNLWRWHGFIRIAFKDLESGSDNVVDFDVDEFYDTDQKNNLDDLYYITSNPIQIKGDISYPPDHFVLSKQKWLFMNRPW